MVGFRVTSHSRLHIGMICNGFSVPAPTILTTTRTENNEIEKAILKSDLGLNPNSSGDLIRIMMPALTEETRQDYIKQARNEAENSRISIRNIRRDANNSAKELQKENEISEDELKRIEAEVQKTTDHFIGLVEEELKNKEADLAEI